MIVAILVIVIGFLPEVVNFFMPISTCPKPSENRVCSTYPESPQSRSVGCSRLLRPLGAGHFDVTLFS